MRLLYDPQAHERERQSWKLVIYLNVITAVRVLLECIERVISEQQQQEEESAQEQQSPGDESTKNNIKKSSSADQDKMNEARSRASAAALVNLRSMNNLTATESAWMSRTATTSTVASSNGESSTEATSGTAETSKALRVARLRLAPLLSLEEDLRNRLGAVGDHIQNVPAYLRERAGQQDATPDRGATSKRASVPNDFFTSKTPIWHGTTQGAAASGLVAAAEADEDDEDADLVRPLAAFNAAARRNDLVLKAGWQQRASPLGTPPEVPDKGKESIRRPSTSASRKDGIRSALGSLFGGGENRDGSPSSSPKKDKAAEPDSPHSDDLGDRLKQKDEDDPQSLLFACKEEIQRLWKAASNSTSAGSSAKNAADGGEKGAVEAKLAPTGEEAMGKVVRTIKKSFMLDRQGAATL